MFENSLGDSFRQLELGAIDLSKRRRAAFGELEGGFSGRLSAICAFVHLHSAASTGSGCDFGSSLINRFWGLQTSTETYRVSGRRGMCDDEQSSRIVGRTIIDPRHLARFGARSWAIESNLAALFMFVPHLTS